ncbi:MAG: VOC family protein [Ardenticatenales bacterium]|nr:VOC family protein [Ardenticatenales bacterium]
MDLGEFLPCLNVRDLEASIQFYETIGFRLIEDGRAENWAVLQHNNMAVALYQGHIRENLINFPRRRHPRDRRSPWRTRVSSFRCRRRNMTMAPGTPKSATRMAMRSSSTRSRRNGRGICATEN